MARTVIPAIGRCIYCLRQGIPLEKEHVIPEGLGGDIVLLKASCRNCAEAIRPAEQFCIRNTFQAARTYLKIRSKKKHKNNVRRFHAQRTPGGGWKEIPFDKYPFVFSLPVFDPPPILSGVLKTNNDHMLRGVYLWFSPGYKQKMDALGKELAVFTSIEVGHLFRFIAKIAHGIAVADLGLDGFEPLATNLIRGIPDDISTSLVGTAEMLPPVWDQIPLHAVGVFETDDGYVGALVQLFTSFHPPAFQVVVGRTRA